jgi:hypothetical protein
MILNVPRMLASWCGGATHGVNALLASVSRDAGDPLPPNLATIVAEADSGRVARSQLPTARPCLAISCDHVLDLDGQVQVNTADGKVKVRFRLAVEEADTDTAIAQLGIYLRALTWSIRRFVDERFNPANDPSRTRNGIYMETLEPQMASQIQWAPDQQDSSTVTAYLIATFQARDLSPFGA